VAIGEHLAYIDALLARDRRRVEAACRAHLTSARQTLRRAFLAAVPDEVQVAVSRSRRRAG
jgi:DNA-binding GntR family transcriptional regulator